MKRTIIIILAVLLGGASLSAKTVRGYILDSKGNPVEGQTVAVVCVDRSSRATYVKTDSEGYFETAVPDDLDLLSMASIFCPKGAKVISFQERGSFLRITVGPDEESKNEGHSKTRKDSRAF